MAHPGISPAEQDAIDDAVAASAALKADKTTIASDSIDCKLDAKGAAATDVQVIGVVPFAGTVTAVEVIANAAVTGDNTNTRSFALTNKGQAGAGTTSVATLALTTGNDLVAFDAKTMTLTATTADRVVAAGDVLSLAQTVGASGLAHSGGIARVVLTRAS